MLFDARAFDRGVEMVSEFALIMAVKFSTQEGGDLIGFDGVDGGAGERFVERFEIFRALKEDIRGLFNLHEAPVIGCFEVMNDGTIQTRSSIQDTVKGLNAELIGQPLSGGEIIAAGEGVVRELMGHSSPGQFCGQPVMAVEVELKPKGTPCRDAQVTQTQRGIDKVEIIMKALPGIGFQKRFVSDFIVPGFVGRAGLQGRKNMNQSWVSSATDQDFFEAVFLAETIDPPDEFDGQPFFLSEGLGVGANAFREGFSEARIVENADVVRAQIGCHPLRIAEPGKRALDYDSIPTGENSLDTVFVAFGESCHRYPLADREYHDSRKKSSCLVPATPD